LRAAAAIDLEKDVSMAWVTSSASRAALPALRHAADDMTNSEAPAPQSGSVAVKWVGFHDLSWPRFVSQATLLYVGIATLNHPLAVVKTRLQHGAAAGSSSSSAALRGLFRAHGARGLYVAFLPATLGALPGELLYVASVERMRSALGPASERWAPVIGDTAADGARLFVAGAAANLTSLALFTPVDVVVQRAFVAFDGRPGGRPFNDAVRATWLASGAMGFYRGYLASLALYAPGCAVWWSVYAMARHPSSAAPSTSLPPWASDATAGLVAGTASGLVTHPLDTIKTRLQVRVN
jgi:hypothetical protein